MFRTRTTGLGAALAAVVVVAGLVSCRPDVAEPDAPPSQSADASQSGGAVGPGGQPGKPSADASGAPDAPSGKRRVVDAEVAGGLRKLTDDNAVSDIPVDPGDMRKGMNLVVSHFEAPPPIRGPILFEGVDNVPEDTTKRREHLWRGMLDYIQWDYELGQPSAEPVDPGPLGGSVECMLASLVEDGNVICGWADENTAAVALFKDTDIATAAPLFVKMRADLEK